MKTMRMALALLLISVAGNLVKGADAPAPAEPNLAAKPGQVNEAFPDLASGSLTNARLAELPAGVCLQAEGLSITEKDLAEEMAKASAKMQEQLKKNGFYLLESLATQKLLLMEAKTEAGKSKTTPAAKESELIQNYVKGLVAKVEVSEPEVKEFYEKNKELCGGATLDQIKDQLKQFVLQEKQQQFVDQHIRTWGQRQAIEVAAAWTKKQSILARDNQVDKARTSGKPSLVDFGSTGCRPCDMMNAHSQKPEREICRQA